MRRIFTALLLLPVLSATGAWSEEGLVAHWDFSEGSGTILHDRSGNGSNGTIKGAEWVRNGRIYALKFDGIDDHVDCGDTAALDLREHVSIAAWIKPEPAKKPGEAGIAGKAYGSYVLTMYYDQAYSYVSGPGATTYGSTNISTPVRLGAWSHVVSTYDGKTLRIYLDGKLSTQKPLEVNLAKGAKFWIARSDGDVRYTQNSCFHGQISDLRVYNRALSPTEVSRIMDISGNADTLDMAVVPLPTQSRLALDISRQRLTDKTAPISVAVEVLKSGSTKPLITARADAFSAGRSAVSLNAAGLRPGEYTVRATAYRKTGKQPAAVGTPATVSFTWPEVEKFPNGPKGARRLNNLVTELLNVESGKPGASYAFTNPRDGWVYISSTGASTVVLTLPSGEKKQFSLPSKWKAANETMRELPAGKYAISAPAPGKLVVRAIPELVYAQYDAMPIIKGFGAYAGEFEQKHIFPHTNTLMASGLSGQEPFVQTWKNNGGKWVVHCTVPQGTEDKPLTVQDAFDFLASTVGYDKPDFAGPIADEFGNSEPYCAIYAEAVRKLKADPRFRDKVYYPFANDLFDGPEGRELVSALLETDGKIPWKRYLKEQHTEINAWHFLDLMMLRSIRGYQENCPGSLPNIIICFGNFSAPNETLDTFPHVDYRTYLDMQFNMAANHPDFKEVGGLMTYLAHYCDEEIMRLGGLLFRHYGIEGRTEPFINDPYILTHLQDGDFDGTGRDWTFSPAEAGSMRRDISPGFGWLQGRYPRTTEGDTALVTRRSGSKPNVFTQQIRNLQPGRLYSLRLFSGDFRDMSEQQKHAVSIQVDGVTLVPERSFSEVFRSCYSHEYDKYTNSDPAWMNYHFRVFRANARTANLTVTDWADDKTPGGPVGQELMFNFVQVQPYLEP